jgi:hypothetical protein
MIMITYISTYISLRLMYMTYRKGNYLNWKNSQVPIPNHRPYPELGKGQRDKLWVYSIQVKIRFLGEVWIEKWGKEGEARHHDPQLAQCTVLTASTFSEETHLSSWLKYFIVFSLIYHQKHDAKERCVLGRAWL